MKLQIIGNIIISEQREITYRNRKKNLEQLMNDIFVLDIMREDMKNDDPRLQSIISG